MVLPDVRTATPFVVNADVRTATPFVVNANVLTATPFVVEPDVRTATPVVVEPDVRTATPFVVEPDVRTATPVTVTPVIQSGDAVVVDIDARIASYLTDNLFNLVDNILTNAPSGADEARITQYKNRTTQKIWFQVRDPQAIRDLPESS